MLLESFVLLLVALNMSKVTTQLVSTIIKHSSPIYPYATSTTYANSPTTNSKSTIYMPAVSVMNLFAIHLDN